MEIIKLNLIPSGVNSICHCSQYDNGRVIRLELFDGLTPYTLQSGDTVTLNVRKPDNTIITANVTATQGNNYVDIVTTEQMCAVVGNNLCDLTITNGSVVIGTLNFYMQIERDVLSDGNPSQSVIRDLNNQVNEAVLNTNLKPAIVNYFSDMSTRLNYANNDGWISGKYIKANTGELATATRYSYQFAPVIESGVYCTYRKYGAFGAQAPKISLHDKDKNYIKTINADSYDQSTGIMIFTINNDDLIDGQFIGLSTMDNERVNLLKGNVYQSDYIPRSTIDIADRVKNSIYNSVLICDGDSICNGAKDLPDNLRGWWSRLNNKYKTKGENYAVNGASISYISSDRHCVARTIDTIYSDYPTLDYLILEGGTNDADLIGRIISGTIPENFGTWDESDYSGNYDDTTFCGAVDMLFYKAVTYYAGSKIGYIIPMQMGSSQVSVNTILNRRAYFDEVIKIANKWHIPVLDLWKTSTMDGRLAAFYDVNKTGDQNVSDGKYYYDGQHPTSRGYDLMQNKIDKWVENL